MILNKTFLRVRRSLRTFLREFVAPDPAGLKDMTAQEQTEYVDRLREAKRAQVEQWRKSQ
jgi:acetoin utilization deacetylase AcuC-like enzyme